MFHPRAMAVFGAVTKPGGFAHSIVLSQMRYGYTGRLYPVSLGGGQVAGLRVYRSLGEVEGPVDLASVSVPAGAVPEVLRDCVRHGVAGAQIHTSGFAETGEAEGKALQADITRIAEEGIRLIGPNCFGIHCPRGGITLLPGFDFSKEPGPVALISQSGGGAKDFAHETQYAGIGLSKVVSYGNGCDLGAVDLLTYLSEDPETGYVGAYLEGVPDGRRFLEVVRRMTARKPMVVWKGGLTPFGGRAAMSHTGSLSGEGPVWKGALTQAGAVAVDGLDEMIDTLVALTYLKSRGRRIALVGGGGAIGVFTSDLAHRLGLELPLFSEQTQSRLKKWFRTPGNSVRNPLDTGTPAMPLEPFTALLEEVLTREPIDVLVCVMLLHPLEVVFPTFMEMEGLKPEPKGAYFEGLLQALKRLKRSTGKDVVMVIENRAHRLEYVEFEELNRMIHFRYQAEGIPVYSHAERALRGIRNASFALCPQERA